MMRIPLGRAVLATTLVLLGGQPATADEEAHTLIITNHRFEPSELKVPAGQKIKLIVENRDATPEEFESYALSREKIINGNQEAVLFLGPLEPGSYEFFGEFHSDTAKGRIIAK